jgi:hypothetical protein
MECSLVELACVVRVSPAKVSYRLFGELRARTSGEDRGRTANLETLPIQSAQRSFHDNR